jgi:hypothetical protein
MLLDGSLNLTTLRLLVPYLKASNRPALLDAAANKSKREVAELVARLFPKPDVPPSIETLRVPAPPVLTTCGPAAGPPACPSQPTAGSWTRAEDGWQPAATAAPPVAAPTVATSPPAAPRPLMTPLAADRYQITFTAD